MTRKIALVGIGKIALDQHVPAIEKSNDWELAATVSRSGKVAGIEAFIDMETMLAKRPDIECVSFALPPVPRFDYAAMAIAAGRHVMLEKPPGATIAECYALEGMAHQAGVSIFTTWHSREARAVDDARDWIKGREIDRIQITWRENVRQWHPGQDWIFETGGMGVFDPGINALSILTKIFPDPISVERALLKVPKNRETPIEVELSFRHARTHIAAHFDFLKQGEQVWDIEIEAGGECLRLSEGGANLSVNGQAPKSDAFDLEGEYPRLYAQFAKLVDQSRSDFDIMPLVHVIDAFGRGKIEYVEEFNWQE